MISVGPYEVNHMRQVDTAALELLLSWVGKGEVSGRKRQNNRGTFIEGLRENDGTRRAIRGGGAWCAVCQIAADRLAALNVIGVHAVPHDSKLNRSAKRYTQNVAKAGEWVWKPRGPFGIAGVTEIDELLPGDRICAHRGDLSRPDTRRLGHVMRVVEYKRQTDTAIIVEGNRNNRTDEFGDYSVIDTRKLHNGAWRRRLYGASRLVPGGL